MDWIAWDDSLDTGHAGMDAEHRQMAGLFNLLRDAVESGQGKAACTKVLDDIIQQTQTHFDVEQRLMQQHRYPKIMQHAAEHAMLLSQAQDFRDSFNIDTAASRTALKRFPEVWLAFHILFSDKSLAAFLARRQHDPGAQ
ncbi:MAG: hypothetical protein D4R74_06835 [Betaproteobacteria bacterium]|nr:MAG: hypothetical protein D4R74_06835 [Betaproteobacteria bacterium]